MKQFPRKKILVVDDDFEDQEIFGDVIHEVLSAVDCSFASSAEDALDTLEKSPENLPDYIFLDLNLPFMSGFECLDTIKKQPQLNNIPVIIYSTSSRYTDRQKAKALGAINYISKPNSTDELKTLLRNLLAS